MLVQAKSEAILLAGEGVDIEVIARFADRRPSTAASSDKKICVVWDNASWHKTRIIRDQLAKGASLEKVHLVALPPYAPDHYPIEHVWKAAKDHSANIQQTDFEDTLDKFEAYIASRPFNYEI
ncbi:MAG: transposase [Bifidobacteriaceae bacterium]|jgi:transposase|nr:transposase [Bifidobacteriaceae bacterium]